MVRNCKLLAALCGMLNTKGNAMVGDNGFNEAAKVNVDVGNDDAATPVDASKNEPCPHYPVPDGVRFKYQPLTAASALQSYTNLTDGDCDNCGVKMVANHILVEVSPVGVALHAQCEKCGMSHLLALYNADEAIPYRLPTADDTPRALRTIIEAFDNPNGNYDDPVAAANAFVHSLATEELIRIRRIAAVILNPDQPRY